MISESMFRGKKRRQGFTFAEVAVVVVLTGILLGLGLYGVAGSRSRATSQGMVAVVAAEMEAARERALSSGLPVAFCLPTGDGAVPYSQSYYLMTGEAKAKVTQQRSLSGDFPQASMAVVFWDPATLTPPDSIRAQSEAAAKWLDGQAGSDFAIIFMPDGTVASNGLPIMDGEYRLVVASAFDTSPDSLSGTFTGSSRRPKNFRLNEVFAAQTLCLSAQGEIRVESGIPDSGAVRIATARFANSNAPAPLIPMESSASTLPKILSVAVYPKPFLEPKATVMQDRNLTLQVQAGDDDGQALFGTWKATPVGTARGEGQFSLGPEHPLVWDKKLRRWTAQCTWAPPLEAEIGDQYKLTFTVRDSDGNEHELTADVLNPVTIIPPGRILLQRQRGGKADVAIINADGTGLRYLTDGPLDDTGPGLSPDGSQIAWVNKNDISNGTYGQVYVMNIDGSGKRKLTDTMSIKGSPTWSPDGLKIIYMRAFRTASGNVIGDGDRLRWCNPDGSAEDTLGTIQGSSSYSSVFSPDGLYLINVANLTAPGVPQISSEMIVSEYSRTGTGPPQILNPTNVTNDSSSRCDDSLPTFLPVGSEAKIVWSKTWPGPSGNYSDAIRTLNLARIKDNGSTASPRFELADQQVIRNESLTNLVFSPDGKKVLYTKSSVQGILIADWNDDGSTKPTITNERRLTGLGGIEYPRAWMKF